MSRGYCRGISWDLDQGGFHALCVWEHACDCVLACSHVSMWPCACLSLCVPSGLLSGGGRVRRLPDAVYTCLMAVKKPCGLKKPVIQKQLGRPSKIHAWNCRFRSSNSVNQNPRVLEAHDAWKTKTKTTTLTKHYDEMLKTVIQVHQRRRQPGDMKKEKKRKKRKPLRITIWQERKERIGHSRIRTD